MKDFTNVLDKCSPYNFASTKLFLIFIGVSFVRLLRTFHKEVYKCERNLSPLTLLTNQLSSGKPHKEYTFLLIKRYTLYITNKK